MGKRILVVEAQEDNRQILRDLLSSADFEVIESVDGEARLAAAADHRPDLILMDMQMPILDGYEATRRLKADAALHAIPVIAVTSYASSSDVDNARAAGCDAFVSKLSARVSSWRRSASTWLRLHRRGDRMTRWEFIMITLRLAVVLIALLPQPLTADYKPEFKMSIVPNEETTWGRAAKRFADTVKYRTQGRIQIKNYFGGQLGQQTTEFALLQQGLADFAIGSTINWSPQVRQLNIFVLPFMFPGYAAVDAVEGSEPGERLFKLIEQNGVFPIAWGENGFRELTNSKRPIQRPEDFDGLKIRVAVPLLADTLQALGANPVMMNFDEALEAFRMGTVDGQENPVALIIPYKFWAVHKYMTLWHYAIDPLILAVSGKTWAGFSVQDQNVLRKAGEEIMGQQKKESREGLEETATVIEKLQDIYGMEVFHPSPVDVERFRNKTRSVYDKWTKEIGMDLVGSVERMSESAK